MTMQLVEEAWLLWARIGFRKMVHPHRNGPNPSDLLRLWRLGEQARVRYYRRKQAIGGEW